MKKEKATVYDFARMCDNQNEKCHKCKLHSMCRVGYNCTWVLRNHTDESNNIILNWCKEHPVKTRQDKFLEHYPHARAKKFGVLDICPKIVDIRVQCMSEVGLSCSDCKKSYWLAEVEE